jgi:4-diphosphocytidyl-2-C-methyl-D-erythritol kinase
MTLIHEFAPAKLNLYLHITGRRADGYHELDSLVAFATIGDELVLTGADCFSFNIEGPHAAALASEDHTHNLVVAASHSLAELTERDLNVAMTLVKNLPIASGIGGGSSDAAAALRALARHWGMAPRDKRLLEAAARHGQDVPVCLVPENNYMTATGVVPATCLPRVPVVLVNPGKGLPTPSVFKEFRTKGDAFSPLSRLEQTSTSIAELVTALKQRGNDLYAPAVRLMPEIAAMIAALNSSPDCLLARMSGSGATCFALYANDASAQYAAEALRCAHPHWWIDVGAINA